MGSSAAAPLVVECIESAVRAPSEALKEAQQQDSQLSQGDLQKLAFARDALVSESPFGETRPSTFETMEALEWVTSTCPVVATALASGEVEA